MSLNQRYTWKDFLKENPEFKGKKRTSAEAGKAFESAFRAKMKDILKDRLAWIEKETVRVAEERKKMVLGIKAASKPAKRRKIDVKVSAADKYAARLSRQTTSTKQIQKSI